MRVKYNWLDVQQQRDLQLEQYVLKNTFNLTIVSQWKDEIHKQHSSDIVFSFVCNYMSIISTVFYKEMNPKKSTVENLMLIVMKLNNQILT